MARSQHVYLDEIVAYFDELEDPRSTINQKHPLVSVVVIAMMSVLAGAGGPTAIATWAKLKAAFLVNVLELPNGIPGKDVFRRVLSLLKPEAFQHCFATWLQSLRQKAAEETGVDQPVFAVDGKTSRRSHDRKKGLGALHSVSVWASEFNLSLGQVACADQSNEITAIPELSCGRCLKWNADRGRACCHGARPHPRIRLCGSRRRCTSAWNRSPAGGSIRRPNRWRVPNKRMKRPCLPS